MEETDAILLGAFANSLSIVIKEHAMTNVVFKTIKEKFETFIGLVKEKSGNAVEILQTGSSYDDLHMCRCVSGLDKDKAFFPPTDFDFMMVYTQYLVDDFTNNLCNTENIFDDSGISQAISNSSSAFIMVSTDHVGYVRLLVTNKGRHMLQGKKHSNFITQTGYFQSNSFKKLQGVEPNVEIIYRRNPGQTEYISSGPALTKVDHEVEGYTYDLVFSFPCSTWPKIAGRWSKRPRDAKWPNQRLIDEIVRDGCAVVPVGFYNSEYQDLEWRLSFNKSERKLSQVLTRNQRICYCIVKLLVKTCLSEKAILSSYMVKNMMFWFCEQMYGINEWDDSQIGERILQLIDYIITALTHHNIPHYFLPRNNLIQHRSNEEVQETIAGLKVLRETPFSAFHSICRKMQIFEVQKDDVSWRMNTRNEMPSKLILFTSLGKLLFELAMLNDDTPSFAVQCCQAVLTTNMAAKSLVKSGTNLFTATTLIDLLKPYAIQFMQAREVDKALNLFKIIIEGSQDDVLAYYPEAITNIACLETCKLDSVTDTSERESMKTNIEKHFKLALKHHLGSPSLHLAYGNFLKDAKGSLYKAMEQYKAAINIVCSRPDDDALVQITLPGKKGDVPKPVYLPGKVVAYYSLIELTMNIGDVCEARKLVRKLSELIKTFHLKVKTPAGQLCYYSYLHVGLYVKARLFRKEQVNFTC